MASVLGFLSIKFIIYKKKKKKVSPKEVDVNVIYLKNFIIKV